MQNQQENIELLEIVGTDLFDYSLKVEKAIKEGWTFSDKNEYCPRAWPHMFQAFLLKPSESKAQPKDALLSLSAARIEQEVAQGITVENKEATEPVKQVTKRGRK